MAIGNCIVKPYVHLFSRSTNQTDYRQFIRLVIKHIDPNLPAGTRPYLLHDGHAAHRVQESIATMQERFQPLRYPKYSSRFNSIESLFGVVKNAFRKINLEKTIQ